jgi:NADH-quinone oxidoreductase subunit J
MNAVFYIAAGVAVVSTVLVITQFNPVHALLYLIVSLMSVSLIFFLLGAPFAAALEVIIYAGAIMVLFVFVVMMLNLGNLGVEQEQQLLNPRMWLGPSLLVAVLMIELVYTLAQGGSHPVEGNIVGSKAVGLALFGPYLLGVELASMLLLAGLVGAHHLGRRTPDMEPPGEETS